MAKYQLPYYEFAIPPTVPFPSGQTVRRPLFFAELFAVASGKSINCAVWPDSGADHCVFPVSFASPLGLDPANMKMQTSAGVGNSANDTYYEHVEVRIAFPDAPTISFKTYAGFTAGMEAQGIGLLGQAGFFESFKVSFDYQAKLFFIETY